MRLLKRRSAPVFAHDPPPSTISLVDLPGPGVASTSTLHVLPPLPKSNSTLDIHLPPLPSNLAPRTPRTPKTPSHLGTEYAEAHNNPGGNVFSSSSNSEWGDEDRRWTHASRWNGHMDKTEAVAAAGSSSMSTSTAAPISPAKRDSGGQNRYPPNSLVPGNGWSFGRMRRSRKQDLGTAVPPLRKDSLSWRQGHRSKSPPPMLPQSAPATPVPDIPTASTPLKERFVSPAHPTLHIQRPSYSSTHSQPIFTKRNDSSFLDPQETLLARTNTASSLSRSVSLSETTASGESLPLLQRNRRRSASLALPLLRRDNSTPAAPPRKLQKRRTGSQDSTAHRDSNSKVLHIPLEHLPGSSANRGLIASDPVERKEDQGVQSTPPSLPEGAEPPALSTSSWTLARNSSTSTQASSMIAPSTDESTVLTPPYDPHRDQRLSDRWDALGALGIPTVEDDLSRSSTLSFREGDDKLQRPNEVIDMRQMLSEGFPPDPFLGEHNPAGDDSNQSLHSPSLATMRSESDTTVSFSTALEGGRTTAPTPDIQSLSSGVTSRPVSRLRNLPIDITTSPQRVLQPSPSLASLADSPSQTVSSTSTPRSFGPISRFRRPGHTRSRASSLSAISNNRESSYSVGEINVANHGAMTTATTVRLPDLTPSPQPEVEQEHLLSPPSRPGNKRSQSDLGQTQPKGLLPFLSRESLKRAAGGIPPPSLPRLRSAPSLEISTSAPPIEELLDESPVVESPAIPARTSSLGRLWRKLSVGRKKSKSGSNTSGDSASATINLPKSRSCVDVTPGNNLLDSPLSLRAPLDEIIPEVPSPGPRSSSLIAAARARAAQRASDLSFASSSSAGSSDLLGRKPINQRTSSLSTPPSLVISDHSTSGSYFPQGLTGSSLPRAAEPPSTSTILEGVAVTSTPEPAEKETSDYLSHPASPRTARRQRPRFSMGAGPTPTAEERKRYRQTLVDIQDDVVFHQVLQDLARLDQQGSEKKSDPERSAADMQPVTEVDRQPWRADKGEVRAWFVTREMVQGERRHGRLLARGVATVQAAAESRRHEVPPLPTSVSSSTSTTSLHVLPAKQSFLSRRNPNSKSSTSITHSSSSSTTNLPSLSITTSPKSRTRSTLPRPPPSPTASPLDLLRERLPRLLALSLTLSSRFEDDPSPHGVAEAFVNMEDEMIREIGLWAGEVGNIVAMGMGDMLDMNGFSRGRGRRSISGDAPDEDEQQEDRLGFADIIIMPIQRAARYKLLFREMMVITATPTSKHEPIGKAVLSAERLAEECDRRQDFDLHAIRRQITSPQQSKKNKKRPRSLGGVNNVQYKEKSWTTMRAVTASEA